MRGSLYLPHGVGKPPVLAVFAKGEQAEEALKAGAEYVGAEDLVKMIEKKDIPFDKCIATPSMMGMVGKLGRILGPGGLMPNIKLGTITNDVSFAISQSRMGEVNYRLEKTGVIACPVAKIRLSEKQILENIQYDLTRRFFQLIFL